MPGESVAAGGARRIVPFVSGVSGTARLPGSKSITNRALLCAGLARGVSELRGALVADDTEAMTEALRILGARVETGPDATTVKVCGIGPDDPAAGLRPRLPLRSADVSPDAPDADASPDADVFPDADGRPAERFDGPDAEAATLVPCRKSGLTARLLLGVLCGLDGQWLLDGEPQLRERPFEDGIAAVRSMGGQAVETSRAGRLPLRITGRPMPFGPVGPGPTGPVGPDGPVDDGAADDGSAAADDGAGGAAVGPVDDGAADDGAADASPTGADPVGVPGVPRVQVRATVSSQFVSGLLIAAPITGGIDLCIADPAEAVSLPYVEMTLDVMEAFGAKIERLAPGRLRVAPGGYVAACYDIEPDASAAGYFWAAAAVAGGTVTVDGLGAGSIQGDTRLVEVLRDMGASAVVGDREITVSGPPTGAVLRGGAFDLRDCSDAVQTLAAVAAFAQDATTITGVGFIRRKETDRIGNTVRELQARGVDAEATPDGLVVRPFPAGLRAGRVRTYDDHRMAMSMSLLGLRVAGIEIADPQCVAKTFPGFFDALEELRPRVGARCRADQRVDAPHSERAVQILAIDGPAASGKSSVARALAQRLGMAYLDTGAMYRAVAWAALRDGLAPDDAAATAALAERIDLDIDSVPLPTEPDVDAVGPVVGAADATAGIALARSRPALRVRIDGIDATEAIRSPEVDRCVSAVAANPAVRRVLVRRQRVWAAQVGGGVIEGRDIGSVVFPDASLKVYLTATPQVRAARRLRQTTGSVHDAAVVGLAADLAERDRLDSSRTYSPLRVAPTALIVDSSDLSQAEVVDLLVGLHAQTQPAPSPTGSRPALLPS